LLYIYLNKNEDKIHIIKSALLIEKLIKDNNFTDKKNRVDRKLLKDIIGKYTDTETLNWAKDAFTYLI
jgi:ATP-dependent Lon protease